jgi:ADP-ribosylglycohydrolase
VSRQRALQSLRGLSIGDALGCALTNAGRGEPSFVAPPWRYTDDTEMAIAIVEMLDARGAIDQDALALAFAERFARQTERGYGPVAYWILTRIGEGMPWRVASTTPYRGAGSKGNGGAMRVAPLGAYFAEAPDRAISEAMLSAAVTHAHPQGQAGAAAVAYAATLLARGPGAGIDALADVARRTEDSELRAAIEQAAGLKDTDPAEAGRRLGTGQQVIALDTVPFALWAAFTHPRDYRAAITLAMRGLAGPRCDADTICAIVGGLVAISADADTIPREWLGGAEALDSTLI